MIVLTDVEHVALNYKHMAHSQLITYGIPNVDNLLAPNYSSSSYKLGEEVANGVKWWGQVNYKKNQYTALFICPRCQETFRSQITKVLNGAIITCNDCC